jgi:hypothetical protein
MERVADRIVRAFEGLGYELLGRAGESVRFRRGAEEVNVHLLQSPLTSERLPVASPGGRHILVVLAGADLRSLSEAESRGLEVWDRERFRREIGEILLDEAISFPGPGEAEAGDRLPPLEEGVAEPTVTRERAMEIAARVGPFNCRMLHVPWYLLHLEVRGRERRRIAVAVNAVSGQVVPWRKWFSVRRDATWPHVTREPKFDTGRAQELAIAALRRMLSGSETKHSRGPLVSVRKDFDEVTVEDVSLTGAGLFQMPHWCVEGTRGMVVINAATGTVVEESYFEDGGM